MEPNHNRRVIRQGFTEIEKASKKTQQISVTETMTGSKRNWRLCGDLLKKIMEVKGRDEKRIERAIDTMELITENLALK
jgi:hypothetical protein